MTHDEIQELLGAYALDAVEPDERDEIEEHLLSCPRCRAEVADHREVAAMLAHAGADAPAGVWARIADTLDAAPPRMELAPVQAIRPSRRWVPSRVGTAIAVAAALLITVLGVQVRDQDQRIDELQTALHDPMKPAFEAALGDPDATRFVLRSNDGDLVVRGAVADDGIAYVGAEALPTLAADRTYQLWGAVGDELVSLGVLGSDPRVISFPVEGGGYRAFAITEEQAPGVVQSRNSPVVAGSVTA